VRTELTVQSCPQAYSIPFTRIIASESVANIRDIDDHAFITEVEEAIDPVTEHVQEMLGEAL